MKRGGVKIWDCGSVICMPNFARCSDKSKKCIPLYSLGNYILNYLNAHLVISSGVLSEDTITIEPATLFSGT